MMEATNTAAAPPVRNFAAVHSSAPANDVTFSRSRSVSALSTKLKLHSVEGKTMLKNGNELHALPSKEDLGERWARFLRSKYPSRDTAKLIMRDFGCKARTATAWLGGQSPHPVQLARAGQLFGPVAIAAVLFPETHFYMTADIQDAVNVLDGKLKNIKRQLGELHEKNHTR